MFVPLILMAAGQRRFVVFLLASLTIVIAYFTVLPSALERYGAGYLQGELNAAGAAVRVIMNLLPALILLLSGDRLYRSFEERMVWRTFALMAVLAAIALPFVASSVIVDRLSIYLIPLQIFVLSRLPSATSHEDPGLGMKMLVILYTGAVLFIWLNYAVNAGSWLPYRSYIF